MGTEKALVYAFKSKSIWHAWGFVGIMGFFSLLFLLFGFFFGKLALGIVLFVIFSVAGVLLFYNAYNDRNDVLLIDKDGLRWHRPPMNDHVGESNEFDADFDWAQIRKVVIDMERLVYRPHTYLIVETADGEVRYFFLDGYYGLLCHRRRFIRALTAAIKHYCPHPISQSRNNIFHLYIVFS